MILGIPVVEGQDLTKALLDSLEATVTGNNFRVVIYDNSSEVAYDVTDYEHYSFPVFVVHSEANEGFYKPLRELYAYMDDPLIGLIHNDMVLYEKGWNERMERAFLEDPKLGLVGLCGSNEIDELGGRGGGTMCYFRGADVQIGNTTIKAQDQAAGRRMYGVEAACVLDSLFMMFRREAIPLLVHSDAEWNELTLAHFYDRIWPCRVIEAGYHVAVMGVECDHLGGMTTTANQRYRDDCVKWLAGHGFDTDNPETDMYLIAERRFLSEYRDEKKFLPCKVGPDYAITHFAR